MEGGDEGTASTIYIINVQSPNTARPATPSRIMINPYRILASLCILLSLLTAVDASVASQFHLQPARQDVSRECALVFLGVCMSINWLINGNTAVCYMKCHSAVTSTLQVSWARQNGDHYITKNCETSVRSSLSCCIGDPKLTTYESLSLLAS